MKIWMENHGSLWLARPMDDAARQWLKETAPEEAQFFGDALAMEPRYVEGFENAVVDAGGELL